MVRKKFEFSSIKAWLETSGFDMKEEPWATILLKAEHLEKAMVESKLYLKNPEEID